MKKKKYKAEKKNTTEKEREREAEDATKTTRQIYVLQLTYNWIEITYPAHFTNENNRQVFSEMIQSLSLEIFYITTAQKASWPFILQ